MTVACSMASFGSCVQVRHGATCRRTTVLAPLVTIAIMDTLAAGHDAAVQMIDTSVVRVHQREACIADNNQQDMHRSRGGRVHRIRHQIRTRASGASRSLSGASTPNASYQASTFLTTPLTRNCSGACGSDTSC